MPKPFSDLVRKCFSQEFITKINGKHPVIEGCGIMVISEYLLKATELISLYDDLRGFETLQEFVDIVQFALAHKKFTCGDIEK